MPLPSITPLPTPPSRSDSANFASRGDAFLGALPTFQSQMNALAAAVDELYFPQVFRNHLINGDFGVWDESTSYAGVGYGAAQMWRVNSAASSHLVTRQEHPTGAGPSPQAGRYFSRAAVTSVSGASQFVTLTHRIEDVRRFAGKTCTLSFRAKADSIKPIAMSMRQWFGTGGSPSGMVAGIQPRQFNLSTAWTVYTATFVVPDISGKTIGTNGNDFLEVLFWLDAGSFWDSETASLGQRSGTYDFDYVQFEEGSVATPFEQRPPGVERMLISRYWQRREIFYQKIVNNVGAWGGARYDIYFDPPMRAAGSVKTFVDAGRNGEGQLRLNGVGNVLNNYLNIAPTPNKLIYYEGVAITVGSYIEALIELDARL